MTTQLDPAHVAGSRVVDTDGERLGEAQQIYLDDATGNPEWVSVRHGMLGRKEHLVPLDGATYRDGELRVAFDRDQVRGAPEMDAGQHLTVEEEQQLWAHYGLTSRSGGAPAPDSDFGHVADGAADRPAADTGTATTAAGPVGTGTGTGDSASGGDSDGEDTLSMTRSEEQLRVGTERVESGRVRLRRYVTTETVEQRVPVSHEEVRIERGPVPTGAMDADAEAGEVSEAEEEVVLHADRVVAAKETVPVEQVTVHVDDVEEEVGMTERLRSEHIEVEDTTDGPDHPPTDRT